MQPWIIGVVIVAALWNASAQMRKAEADYAIKHAEVTRIEEQEVDATVNSWLGVTAEKMYQQWGLPQSVTPIPGGGQVLEYLKTDEDTYHKYRFEVFTDSSGKITKMLYSHN
jgi:hypothetical protein